MGVDDGSGGRGCDVLPVLIFVIIACCQYAGHCLAMGVDDGGNGRCCDVAIRRRCVGVGGVGCNNVV
jgi:hypothetical protein